MKSPRNTTRVRRPLDEVAVGGVEPGLPVLARGGGELAASSAARGRRGPPDGAREPAGAEAVGDRAGDVGDDVDAVAVRGGRRRRCRTATTSANVSSAASSQRDLDGVGRGRRRAGSTARPTWRRGRPTTRRAGTGRRGSAVVVAGRRRRRRRSASRRPSWWRRSCRRVASEPVARRRRARRRVVVAGRAGADDDRRAEGEERPAREPLRSPHGPGRRRRARR